MTLKFRPSLTRMATSPPRTGTSSLLTRALRETATVWYPGTERGLPASCASWMAATSAFMSESQRLSSPILPRTPSAFQLTISCWLRTWRTFQPQPARLFLARRLWLPRGALGPPPRWPPPLGLTAGGVGFTYLGGPGGAGATRRARAREDAVDAHFSITFAFSLAPLSYA